MKVITLIFLFLSILSVKGQFSNNNELYNYALKRYIELTNFEDSTLLIEGYAGMQYIIDSLPRKINEKTIKYISTKGIKELLKTNEFISLVSIRPMVISLNFVEHCMTFR